MFGTVALRRLMTDYPKWTSMLERHRQKNLFERDDALLAAGGMTWGRFRSQMQDKSEMDRIRAVNSLWNKRPWKSDAANWREQDRWTTPLEFCYKGGDCEDYAIAKMFTLKALGVDCPMRVAVGERKGRGHAVLVVCVDGRNLVLDNESDRILEEGEYDFRLAYSLDDQSAWVHLGKK